MKSTNVLPLPTLARTQFGQQSGQRSSATPAADVAPATASSTATQPVDALTMRDALVAQQPRFGGDSFVVQPTVIPIQPYVRQGSDGKDRQDMVAPSAITMPTIIEGIGTDHPYAMDLISHAFANNIVSFYEGFNDDSAQGFNASMKYLKTKILQERVEDRDMTPEEARNLTPDDPKFDPAKDIVTIEINSPGGNITSLYSMIDIIDSMKKNGIIIKTVTEGLAASCGSMLAALGSPGYRTMTKNSYVMIHQPLGSPGYGQATDLNIHNNLIQDMKKKLTWMLYSTSTRSDISAVPEEDREALRVFVQSDANQDKTYAAFLKEVKGEEVDASELRGSKTYADFVDGMERDNWLNSQKSIEEWGLIDEIVET